MKKYLLMLMLIGSAVTSATAGELKKDYFVATNPGAWAEYKLETADGIKYLSSSQRNADEDGQVVVEEIMKIKTGQGAPMESNNTFVLQKHFNIARDWLSYGKFTEKMKMKSGGVEMPVDANTLDVIKKGSKDFRGAVSFEAEEKVDGHTCDRYGYTVVIAGPVPSKETGQLWLDATVPFGIVRQVAKSFNADGSVASSFEIKLQNTGHLQLGAMNVASSPAIPPVPIVPAVASLIDAYRAGHIGIEVSVAKGSNGRHLDLAFINKTDALMTVKVAAGAFDIPASDPIDALRIVVKKAANIVVPASSSSETLRVEQQPGRGALEGKFELSVYEGTQLYAGSVTRGTVSGK